MSSENVEGFKVEYFGEHSHGPVYQVDLENGQISFKSQDLGIMGKPFSEVMEGEEESSLRETEEIVDSQAGQAAYEILLESGIEPGQTYTRSAGAFGNPTPGMTIEVYDDEDELERIEDIDRTMVEYAVQRLEEALELEE
ncbi:MAG: hypothetical protein ABEJ98_04635 [Candidatus Nanohaloarchaea archaeon]